MPLRVYYLHHGIGTIYTGIFGSWRLHVFLLPYTILLWKGNWLVSVHGWGVHYHLTPDRLATRTEDLSTTTLELLGHIMAGGCSYDVVVQQQLNSTQFTLLFFAHMTITSSACIVPSLHVDITYVSPTGFSEFRSSSSWLLSGCWFRPDLPIFETASESQARDEVGGTVPGLRLDSPTNHTMYSKARRYPSAWNARHLAPSLLIRLFVFSPFISEDHQPSVKLAGWFNFPVV